MRGTLGSRGGMGVYTKCAIRLAHWPGRTDWPVTGTVPAYRLPIDETFRVYTVAVPTWDAWADLYYKIYDNEIGYIFHRQFNLAGADLAPAFWLMYNDPTKQLSDVPAILKEPGVAELTEEMRISFQIVLAGRSDADIELQDKILDAILEEVGGWKVERFCEQDMAEFTNMYLNRLGHKHINFVWAGGYIGSWMQSGTPDWVKGYIPAAAAGLERDAKDGLLVQCGGDAMMGPGASYPGGGNTCLEQFVSYDPADEASTRAGIKHMEDAIRETPSIHRLPARQGSHVSGDGPLGRSHLQELGRRQAAVHLHLPAEDKTGTSMPPKTPGVKLNPGAGGGATGDQGAQRRKENPGPPPPRKRGREALPCPGASPLSTPYTALTLARSSPDPRPADCPSKAVQGGHRDRQTIGDSHPRAA